MPYHSVISLHSLCKEHMKRLFMPGFETIDANLEIAPINK
jgi:hypothetical protein